MVGFAVVGLGMGKSRARMIQETEGAELAVVIDTNEALAASAGSELEVDWAPDLEEALGPRRRRRSHGDDPERTACRHGCIAAAAGKHVITTKPMDVSTSQCDRLIARSRLRRRKARRGLPEPLRRYQLPCRPGSRARILRQAVARGGALQVVPLPGVPSKAGTGGEVPGQWTEAEASPTRDRI